MKNSNAQPKNLKGCGVYILDADESRVLLAQRGPAARHEQFKWEGPGGKLDDGESYEEAAKREIMEELGVDVMLGEVIWEYDEVIDAHGTAWSAKIFKGSISDTPSLPEPAKVCGFGWFTKEEVGKLHQGDMIVDYAVKDLQHLGWLQ